MTTRQSFSVVIAVMLVVGLLASARMVATASPTASTVLDPAGRKLYRQFCGKCHALTAALSAGFGSQNGLGQLGGPSFDALRVPYSVSISAVTLPTGGHEIVKRKITTKQLHGVALYIARVTKNHPVPAFSTDG